MGTPCQNRAEQQIINVGIMTRGAVEFSLDGKFIADGRRFPGPELKCTADGDGLAINGVRKPEFFFESASSDTSFTLKNVTIGIGFHWQRDIDQSFRGSLRLVAKEGKVMVINVVGIEDYLQSVIASEMSPSAGMEFLKAHAVISRSWLLAQLEKRNSLQGRYQPCECDDETALIRWQDREDHTDFDFCADDHCQRYQGIPQCGSKMERKVAKVIEETWGEVLCYGEHVCDARFSKCCGGVTEEFKYCWESKEMPYLKGVRDFYSIPGKKIDLRDEEKAREWILSSPTAFCNTRNARLLGQVMKGYDRETSDFYRWTVEYTQEELQDIIRTATGEDYGTIRDLVPVERGVSGRIWKLQIVGGRKTRIIGKELEIRKTLSRTHLFSSAFVVEKVVEKGFRIPSKFILHGAGWGHGVGLCQIGAAAMCAKGLDYRTILNHYYYDTELTKLY